MQLGLDRPRYPSIGPSAIPLARLPGCAQKGPKLPKKQRGALEAPFAKKKCELCSPEKLLVVEAHLPFSLRSLKPSDCALRSETHQLLADVVPQIVQNLCICRKTCA